MIDDNKKIKEKVENCLNCKVKPCSTKGCPLNNNIPGFINAIKEEKYERAFEILTETTVLPAICGRICPHYKQCMGSCVRGIKDEPVKIGELESFVGDMAIENDYSISSFSNENEKKNVLIGKNKREKKEIYEKKEIAVIGGGPSGITAAAFLARKGHKVTIYEKYNYLGGLLVHGIPDFRLPKEIVKWSVKKVLELGIKVKYNQELGKNLSLEDLEKKYDYIILAFGANVSSKVGIDGEELQGVYGANELLEYNNHPRYEEKTVVVYGGGNVAMDAARTIKKLGAKRVIVAYRRAKEQMPAEQKEIEDAINEGIEFLLLNKIVRIIGKDKVEKIELIKTKLIKKEGQDRPYPVDIEKSNYEIEADYVVMAIGSKPADIVNNLGVELNEKGYIKVDKNGKTSNPKIYAIGDLAGNIATVAWAARSGRDVCFGK